MIARTAVSCQGLVVNAAGPGSGTESQNLIGKL